jgi:hypothetical protein
MSMAQFRRLMEVVWQSTGDASGTISTVNGGYLAKHWRCQWHISDRIWSLCGRALAMPVARFRLVLKFKSQGTGDARETIPIGYEV